MGGEILMELLVRKHVQNGFAEVHDPLVADHVVLVAKRNGGNAEPRRQGREAVVADDDEIRLDPLQQGVELVLLPVADGELRDVAIRIDQMRKRILLRVKAVVNGIVVEH